MCVILQYCTTSPHNRDYNLVHANGIGDHVLRCVHSIYKLQKVLQDFKSLLSNFVPQQYLLVTNTFTS